MSLREQIERSWRAPNLLTVLLWPLSLLYRIAFFLKCWCYRVGIYKTYRAPVPVIVVGNLTVGGTGKTPLVIYLVEELRRQGYTPGVISRGYGGQAAQYPFRVTASSPVTDSGDEPALIVRRTGADMVVGPNRQTSIETLLATSPVDVIISDDGLQHFALGRDIELCLIDSTSPSNNGCLLPAGPYRESLSRLKTVDLIVEHGLPEDRGDAFAMNLTPVNPQLVNQACHTNGHVGRGQAEVTEVEFDVEQNFHALAGIGKPERFFDTCRELGYRFTEHPFNDHHDFEPNDIDFGDSQVLMTEKDAVKCHAFADLRHWYLPVDATLSEQFNHQLSKKLKACS